MVRSRLPYEQRIFVPRKSPLVVILDHGEVISGPFCLNCGNAYSIHRPEDEACPVRRLHPALPAGERETCNCGARNDRSHRQDCNRKRYGFNGTMTV
jgi:hypothetical protein